MMTLSQSQYPTAEEIMKNPVDFRQDTIDAVLNWKEKYFKNWKNKDNDTKLEALERLVYMLAGIYGNNVSVERYGPQYSYSPSREMISLHGNHPSIISTLHEFRHSINGPDERSACRWSVHLFKTCFPEQFAKLEFKPGSHLLVRKTQTA